jgi:hypothetical protein
MSDENEVRKRKPSQEEITEKPTKTIIDEPVHSVSLISLVLKLFLGIAIVVLSLFIRGDFNDDGAGDKMTKKGTVLKYSICIKYLKLISDFWSILPEIKTICKKKQ